MGSESLTSRRRRRRHRRYAAALWWTMAGGGSHGSSVCPARRPVPRRPSYWTDRTDGHGRGWTGRHGTGRTGADAGGNAEAWTARRHSGELTGCRGWRGETRERGQRQRRGSQHRWSDEGSELGSEIRRFWVVSRTADGTMLNTERSHPGIPPRHNIPPRLRPWWDVMSALASSCCHRS